jgi:TolB protein
MDAQGGNRVLLVTVQSGITGMAWSPGGKRIAWTTDFDTVVVLTVSTGTRLHIPVRRYGGTFPEHPTWSPNGRWIAFSEYLQNFDGADIMVVSSTGGTSRRMTRLRGSEVEPSWGPHGRRIAFTRALGPWETRRTSVVSITTHGTDLRVLRDTGDVDHGSAWSPSGHRLALFSDGPRPFGATPRPGLWTIGPDGVDAQWVLRDKSILDVDW